MKVKQTKAKLILPLLLAGSMAACDSNNTDPTNTENLTDTTANEQTDSSPTTEQKEAITPVDIIHTITEVSASAEQEGNPATNVIDGDPANDSRWSANSDDGDVWLDLDLGETKTVNTLQIEFLKALERNTCFNILTSNDGTNWTTQREYVTSYGSIYFTFNQTQARYVRYEGLGNSGGSGWNSIAEVAVLNKVLSGDENTRSGQSGVCDNDISNNEAVYAKESLALELSKSPLTTGKSAPLTQSFALAGDKEPVDNFDLSLWKITYPDASETQPPLVMQNEFYTDTTTGAMVFQCPNYGATTSSSTKYSRTELREMLNSNAGTKELGNNWVISTASAENQLAAGGIDGNMKAILSVDHVSSNTDVGSEYMVGRVIVGQIHASEDEPFKIYYRLLPGHTKGFVYFAYEDSNKETFYPMFGDTGFTLYGSELSAAEPEDGIALGEKWSYEVDVEGRDMTVTVTKADGTWVARTIRWSSEYDSDWFYFKAGAYNQNNGGDVDQFTRVSFYELAVGHQ